MRGDTLTDRWPTKTGAWARQDIAGALTGLAVLAAWEFSALDLPLTRLFGTPGGFPWRSHWLTAGVLHDGARLAGWLFFGLLVISLWQPQAFVAALPRRERVWWLLTTLACAALIPLLKRSSTTSCPWALAEFGGDVARYVPHWLLGGRDGGSGGCFPSGHASTAFALLPGWFALRGHAPTAARRLLIIVASVGALLAGVQLIRGAHYLSHSLWTAWICWAASALSWHALRPWRPAATATHHAPALPDPQVT